jgi:hypothetical protein
MASSFLSLLLSDDLDFPSSLMIWEQDPYPLSSPQDDLSYLVAIQYLIEIHQFVFGYWTYGLKALLVAVI